MRITLVQTYYMDGRPDGWGEEDIRMALVVWVWGSSANSQLIFFLPPSALVNAWNNAELPNYKSRLGWNSTQQGHKKTETTMS